jgi:hypothetical protein
MQSKVDWPRPFEWAAWQPPAQQPVPAQQVVPPVELQANWLDGQQVPSEQACATVQAVVQVPQ